MIVSRVPRSLHDLAKPGFLRSLLPAWVASAQPPFNSRIVTLQPSEITASHNHHDDELWIVLQGIGEVRDDNSLERVEAGDAVYLPPLGLHTLRNIATDRPLSFLTIWWENMSRLAAARERRSAGTGVTRMTLLLPSFPTPNGDLHLGHLGGPYLAADICRRALVAQGVRARLLLGTVGYQTQVAAAARAQGVSFQELAEAHTGAIQQTLAAAGVRWDVFVRPSSPTYPVLARTVFHRLREKGVVVQRTTPAFYCRSCERYLFEAFVDGACPHCQSRATAGIECEACALPFSDADLHDARCRTCHAPAERRELTRFFLPLEPFRQRLIGYLADATMGTPLRAYVSRVLASPLPDFPVTIVSEDGVEIRLPGFEHQRLYSGFELTARYLTAVDELARTEGMTGWEELATTEEPRTLLFFGFDNAFLRAFVFPAVLSSFTTTIPLPDVLVCNHFYTLDGTKFSTSRNHAIWGHDVLRSETCDQYRLYLAAIRTEVRNRDFTEAEHSTFVQDMLADGWEPWLQSVGSRLRDHFGGIAPEAGSWSQEAERFYGQICDMLTAARHACQPEHFSPRSLASILLTFVAQSREFAECWDSALSVPAMHRFNRTCIALELMALRALATAAAPLMPRFAARVAVGLGLSPDAPTDLTPQWVEPGTRPALHGPLVVAAATTALEAWHRSVG